MELFNQIGKPPAPSSVQNFAWQLLHSRIPSRENLRKRGVIQNIIDVVCPFCLHLEKTTSHLIFMLSLNEHLDGLLSLDRVINCAALRSARAY